MINTVTVAGYLGDKPKTVELENKLVITKFSIAVNEVRGKGADRKELTHWIDCTAFGILASTIDKYLTKGSKVTVAGKLNQQKWESEGKKMSRLVVIVDNIAFMSKQADVIEGEVVSEDPGETPETENLIAA